MATVRDLETDALAYLGVLAAGEVMNADDAAFALSALNRLIDQWRSESLLIYTVTRTTWPITSGVQVYTMGPGGAINIPWPSPVEHINFEDTNLSPVLELPLNPLDDDAWSRVRQKGLQSGNYPSCWYSDGNWPLANVSLWPIPQKAGLNGVIYAGTPVAEFASISPTVSLPPGYRRMIVTGLAAELAPSYDRMQQAPLILQMAADAKSAVKSMNSKPLDMSVESGALGTNQGRRLTYSIYTDG